MQSTKNRRTNKMKLSQTIVAGTISLFSLTAVASGGLSGYEDSNYNIGKKAFLHKLYCESCPLAQKPLNGDDIDGIIESLSAKKDLAANLNEKERLAVIHFLKKRFNLQ